jgi:C-terminal processing protease CtpA/Prc
LIGNRTFSAAEDFLINLYECSNRPILIGEPTGGSTGSPLVIEITDDCWARVCTRRVCFPYSKKPFVKEGIQPDILISPTYEDYMNNRDVVLKRAIEYLKTESKK